MDPLIRVWPEFPVKVHLTAYELGMASWVGTYRRISSIAKNLDRKNNPDPKKLWQIDLEGACGELALGKALNIHWPGILNGGPS